MAAQMAMVLDYVRSLLGRAPMDQTDYQLLQRFLTGREEDAFAALVYRHGTLVWSVCQRVLRNPADAEDAFQACFLVLARKAGSIRSGSPLGNWLHGVAVRTSLKIKAGRARRVTCEQQVLTGETAVEAGPDLWAEIQPVLDEELGRLPEKYRTCLIARYLQGKSTDEAARELGCLPGTLAVRLSRGLQLLRQRLARRGFEASATALAAVLADNAQAALPSTITAAAIEAGVLFAAGKSAAEVGVSHQVITLAQGVLHAMFMTKLKVAGVVVLMVALLGTGFGFLAHHAGVTDNLLAADKPGKTPAQPAKGPAPEPEGAKPKPKGGPQSEPQVVELATNKDKGLTVRLKVAPQASLADTSWLVIETENKGKTPLTLKSAYYMINVERPSGFVAAFGGAKYLFLDGAQTLQKDSIHRVVDQPTDFSGALLRLPPKDGLRIHAWIRFHLELADGQELNTPEKGVPFSFDWIYPDSAGFTVLQNRLRKELQSPPKALLENPHNAVLYWYSFWNLLAVIDVPEAAKGVSRDDLLAALDVRFGGYDGRGEIAQYLGKRFANDATVIDYYRKRLQQPETGKGKVGVTFQVIRELNQNPGLWDKSFSDILARLYEADHPQAQEALDTLHKYRSDWVGDGKVAKKLFATVLKKKPLLQKKSSDLKESELKAWADAVEQLAMTGDGAAIDLLRPALEDQRVFRKSVNHLTAMGPSAIVFPMRPCDCALDGILTILDGGWRNAYQKAGIKEIQDMEPGEKKDMAYAALRDRLIADLKKRLPK